MQQDPAKLLEFGYSDLWGGIDWDFIHMRNHYDAIQKLGVTYDGLAAFDISKFSTPSESRKGARQRQWVQMVDLKDILDSNKYRLGDAVRLAMSGDLKVHCTCLTGDTKIPLLDGRSLTIQQLLSEYGTEKPFWLYSSDADGNFVPARATCLGVTGHTRVLAQVMLDNGETVTCTPDHLFRLRDGRYCRADALAAGSSLMPLYRRVNRKGYEQVKRNKGRGWFLTYWRTAEIANRATLRDTWVRIKEIGETRIACHHADERKSNNDPGNLHWLGFREHWDWHAHNSKSRLDAGRLAGTPVIIQWMRDPTNRRVLADRMQRTWEQQRKHMLAAVRSSSSTKAMRAARSQWQKEAWAAPGKRQSRIAGMLVRRSDPAFREKERIAQARAWTPELREKHCEVMQAVWRKRKLCNHLVVSVKVINLEQPVPVYDLCVEGTHNFALEAGVFVHNCEAYKYWGYEFILTTMDAAIKPELRPPNIRNPRRRGVVCKHLGNVLKVFPFWWSTITGALAQMGYKGAMPTTVNVPQGQEGPWGEMPRVAAGQQKQPTKAAPKQAPARGSQWGAMPRVAAGQQAGAPQWGTMPRVLAGRQPIARPRKYRTKPRAGESVIRFQDLVEAMVTEDAAWLADHS